MGGLLWAMAAGVPVITEDTPSGRELVHDGHTGRLVPVSDIHHMGTAVMDLFDGQAAARRLGEAGRTAIRVRFGADVFAARLQAAWRSVVRREPIRFDAAPTVIETTRRGRPAPAPRRLQPTS